MSTNAYAPRRLEYELMRGMPGPGGALSGQAERIETSADEPLRGVAGSGGSAEGRVFVVRDGSELARLPHGAVLVVSACDVGLCPVLPAVRAVVSENGGMVSHGAMLASALGVPVVVGVPNAMSSAARWNPRARGCRSMRRWMCSGA